MRGEKRKGEKGKRFVEKELFGLQKKCGYNSLAIVVGKGLLKTRIFKTMNLQNRSGLNFFPNKIWKKQGDLRQNADARKMVAHTSQMGTTKHRKKKEKGQTISFVL